MTATRERQLRRQVAELRRQWRDTVAGRYLPTGLIVCGCRPGGAGCDDGCAGRRMAREQAGHIEGQAAAVLAELAAP
jgi:hypothetical protein